MYDYALTAFGQDFTEVIDRVGRKRIASRGIANAIALAVLRLTITS